MLKQLIMSIKSSIKLKLIMTIAVLFIFIITCIGLLSYWSTSKTVKDEVDHISQEIIKQANLNLESYFKSYTQGFLLISASPEVRNWMQLQSDDKIDSYLLFDEIVDTYLQPFIFHNPEIISFSLYNSFGMERTKEVKYGRNLDYTLDELKRDINFDDSLFYMDVRVSKEYMISNEQIEMPVLTMVNQYRYGGETGYIKIDIDLQPAIDIINEISIGGSGVGLIVDQDGQIIAHPNQEVISHYIYNDLLNQMRDKQNGSFYNAASNQIVLFQTLTGQNWKTVIVIDFDEFSKSLIEIRYFIIMIATVALIVSLILTILISSSITKRISSLRKAIRRTELKKFQSFVEVEGSDEISELGVSYNRMLSNLEQHVQQVQEAKDLQLDAEFSALQSQIDSHFLYNTLESINSMANLAGEKEIEVTTIALAKMLRYTSSYHGMMVTLQQEYDHLLNYLQIIQTRFGDDFSCEWNVEQQCLDAICLKVLLQPIVENCVKYSMNGEQPLKVQINISKQKREDIGEDLIVVIKDNGYGFSDEKLIEIREQLENTRGNKSHLGAANKRVGLLNIHSRLRMFYSEDPYAGMSIANDEECSGAIVILRFPYRS